MNDRAKMKFVEWVRINEPVLYRVALHRQKLTTKNSGLGSVDWSGIFNQITETAKTIIPAVSQAQAQKKILEVQLERAKSGLDPLDSSQLAPTVKVAAAVTPAMEESAKRIVEHSINTSMNQFSNSLNSMMPFLLLGGGALIFMNMNKKGGRR